MSKNVLRKQILHTLEVDKSSRNSDIRLTQMIWYLFYREKLVPIGDSLAIKIKDLFELPREDSIKRIRAKIQNEEHLFVPTDEKIALKRGFDNVQEWRSFLGYPSGDTL